MTGRALALWVPLVVALTGVFAGIYGVAQQSFRQSLNDPQIQIVEDGVARLAAGGVPAELVARNELPIDISKSLGTWVAVYDAKGTPLESSGVYHNASPQPPTGLFDTTTWLPHKVWAGALGPELRVTWEAKDGTRQALVIAKAPNGYFVVAGRGMHLIEERIIDVGYKLLFGWAFTCLATLIAILLTLHLGRFKVYH